MNGRQVYAVRGREFVHHTAVNILSFAAKDAEIPPSPFISECRTRYPQERCSCHRFNLHWQGE